MIYVENYSSELLTLGETALFFFFLILTGDVLGEIIRTKISDLFKPKVIK